MKSDSKHIDREENRDDDMSLSQPGDTDSSPDTEVAQGDPDGSVPQDSPLALVRKDNKAIARTRSVVVLLLLLAALGTSYFVYYFTRRAEREAFENEFIAIAERMLGAFLADTGRRMNQGSTMATGVTMAMRAYGTQIYNLTIYEHDWVRLTREAQAIGYSPLIAYSPYLKTDEDRFLFEKYATRGSGGPVKTPCFMCGEEGKVTNPENLIELPGTAKYKCSDIAEAGLAGAFPGESCEAIKPAFSASCGCDTFTAAPEEHSNEFQGWPAENGLFRMQQAEVVQQESEKPPYFPLWQARAVVARYIPNLYDQSSEPVRGEAIRQAIQGSTVVFSKMVNRQANPFYEKFGGLVDRTGITVYYPIFDPNSTQVVGVAVMDTTIENYFITTLPTNSFLVEAVMENSCGDAVTIRPKTKGKDVHLIGYGDLHDTSYDSDGLWRSSTYQDFEDYVASSTQDTNTPQSELEYCRYRLSVYPTSDLEEFHQTNEPFIYASVTCLVFLFTTFVFGAYDLRVRRRQAKVMESAVRTNDIVASLFPKNVRDRLYGQARSGTDAKRPKDGGAKESRLQKFLNGEGETVANTTDAIADLFPHVTVVFMDLAGFTAWSSEREPEQVFRLLESLYGAFDDAARAMGVFKVETIGDCYVAACGLPIPKEDHAVVMVRFANECFKRMNRVTHDLERFLGLGTSDLKARCGLHSGPVTAGVLRGEKARFQLFGDTMNFAARLEASGMPDRIHVSAATAEELRRHGKDHWLMERPDTVLLKGKGEMQTYWALPRTRKSNDSGNLANSTSEEESTTDPAESEQRHSEKLERLIDWNVEVLLQHLQPVVNCRLSTNGLLGINADMRRIEVDFLENQESIVVDEMTNILSMPEFDPVMVQASAQDTPIPSRVKQQLRDFVVLIACAYRENPFHNFEHASHVAMSASKIMKRIVSPGSVDYTQNDPVAIASEIHDSTYGISSDPLALFAVVFSALIHDVDHTGLTNAELIDMRTPISLSYRKKSVAEQNSVDLAWEILMNDQFADLRSCIYSNEQEFRRFRQLLVNIVMATDIADKELQALRKNRWAHAFDKDTARKHIDPSQLDADRKATIVLEYIIQASDVAHTMQHWHVYTKFNNFLFEERYRAWIQGVAGDEPSAGWYKGELGFFDFYIIPLARKLDRCGVFGVSYHEYLQYAISNRAEWEHKGKAIVQSMLEACEAKYGPSSSSTTTAALDAPPQEIGTD